MLIAAPVMLQHSPSNPISARHDGSITVTDHAVMHAACRVAIPIEKFYNKAEQEIEDWYELGKNDFASDIGTVSPLSALCLLHAAAVMNFQEQKQENKQNKSTPSLPPPHLPPLCKENQNPSNAHVFQPRGTVCHTFNVLQEYCMMSTCMVVHRCK